MNFPFKVERIYLSQQPLDSGEVLRKEGLAIKVSSDLEYFLVLNYSCFERWPVNECLLIEENLQEVTKS